MLPREEGTQRNEYLERFQVAVVESYQGLRITMCLEEGEDLDFLGQYPVDAYFFLSGFNICCGSAKRPGHCWCHSAALLFSNCCNRRKKIWD